MVQYDFIKLTSEKLVRFAVNKDSRSTLRIDAEGCMRCFVKGRQEF